MPNTFIVSDESVNSYGFVVKTDGIRTDKFERNPIMYYMHERESGIIGRWENLRKEGAQLIADAVFDENDELGLKVKKQVENGFLRSASIGIENIVTQTINGVKTVIECDLKEISIADIPANSNAVKLFQKGGGCVYRLCDLDEPTEQDLRTQLLALLGLENDVADIEILNAVRSLQKTPENIDAEIEQAVMCGYIEEAQRSSFRAMALANKGAFHTFLATKRKEQEPTISRMLTEAVCKGQILHNEVSIYEKIGNSLGTKVLGDLLYTLKLPVKPLDIIRKNGDRSAWTLSDYRRFAPMELRDNPGLYARLIEKENRKSEDTRTLDYYRRNAPEYLRNHPELYRELLEKENANQ